MNSGESALIWAVLTAACWAIGSFFEKSGVKLGGFAPIMGVTIRTFVSVLLLGVLSYPFWPQLRTSGIKPIIMIALGGGVCAGAMGLLFFYKALKLGNISLILPLAFCCTPVFGVIIGVVLLKEKLVLMQYLGISLTIIGAFLTAYYKQ